MNLWKDIPINRLSPDERTARAWNDSLIPDPPVEARCVRYGIRPKRTLCMTGLQALDFIRREPLDIRIALPEDRAERREVEGR